MIRIANAPCSWGILEFDIKNNSNYKKVLDEIKECNYSGTELGDYGFFPTNPEKLKKELKDRNLSLVGAFVPIPLSKKENYEKGIKKALKTSHLMTKAGFSDSLIILSDDNCTIKERTNNSGRIKNNMKLSNKEKLTFAQGANKIAEKVLSKYDLKTVFHHHCGGYIETPDEIDFFMRNTDENLIGLCLDTGHFSFGGGNPIDAIRQYRERIWHVHFKDYSKKIKELGVTNNWDYFKFIENGIFCELNKGNLDFKKISSELIKINYQGWIVVEQDIIPGMGNPIKYAKKNRKFLYSINL